MALAGCAALVAGPRERADALAAQGGFAAAPEAFPLRAYRRGARAPGPVTIFIEGDGARWPRGRPPRDPTPEDPLALRLALADPTAKVAYLGRPCQYLDDGPRDDCPSALWTSARFGDEAIAMTMGAIDRVKAATQASAIHLVGYSGGGALATLIAARRSDVTCLVTIAAPLDLTAWAEILAVAPLKQSVDPLARAAALTAIPQTHFAGGRDRTVPPATLAAYRQRQPHARFELVADFDHECCWVAAWSRLRRQSCLADG